LLLRACIRKAWGGICKTYAASSAFLTIGFISKLPFSYFYVCKKYGRFPLSFTGSPSCFAGTYAKSTHFAFFWYNFSKYIKEIRLCRKRKNIQNFQMDMVQSKNFLEIVGIHMLFILRRHTIQKKEKLFVRKLCAMYRIGILA